MVWTSANADYVFSAPPREDSERGQAIYGPIAEYLTDVLGERVTYHHPAHWVEYSKSMRTDKYDFVFDGPHFSAWRVKHLRHTPVAKLPGLLQFYIVVKSSDDATKMRNLIGSEICGLVSPHLGTMNVFALYNNPVVQPRIRVIKGTLKDVYQAFKKDECRAAVLRDFIYKKLPEQEQALLRIIAQSKPVPNQAITVSQRISEAQRSKIISALTSEQGTKAAEGLLKRFSKRQPTLLEANADEYKGAETLLEGVVWGW